MHRPEPPPRSWVPQTPGTREAFLQRDRRRGPAIVVNNVPPLEMEKQVPEEKRSFRVTPGNRQRRVRSQASGARSHSPATSPFQELYSLTGRCHVSTGQASPSPSEGVRWGLAPPAGARPPCRHAGLGQSPSSPRGRPPRRSLKDPLSGQPCLPAAAHGPVLLPHKRLICYIFSDAVNGRTKTFSLSYFCSIMFVGEPDPLQRGAEGWRGSLPGLLTSQGQSLAAGAWL